jgi:hypothetical protein
MKKINIILVAFISVLTLSCTGDDVTSRPVTTAGSPAALLTPATNFSIVLEKVNQDQTATSVTWEKAVYTGSPTVANYTIEIAKVGSNFSNPTVAGTSTTTSKVFTVKELNAAALNAGFPINTESSVEIRVKSTVGGVGSLPQYSKTNTIKLTPYADWDNWGIIGSATPTGWGSDTNLDYSLGTKKYSITMNMVVGDFKFRLDDAWALNYGSKTSNGILDQQNDNNIKITVAGNYTIVVDFNAKTYTIKKN